MFKIGDFAKMGGVTVKALRLYDRLGLLNPAFVDRFSDYRYYSAEQFARLKRILALKDFGFTLEQVGMLIDEELSSPTSLDLLSRKRADVERLVTEERARLARIEAQLRTLHRDNLEKRMSQHEIKIKKVEPQLVVAARENVPTRERLNATFTRLFDQLAGHLVLRHKVSEFGSPTCIYHSWEPFIDVEAAFPIFKAVPSSEHARVYTLPGVETMATIVHRGSFDTLEVSYGAIMKWIGENNYRIAGPSREINVQYDGNGDPKDWVTEIQFPVTKA